MATVVTNREADYEVFMALSLANACRKLQALPKAGGVLDQDAYHMRLLMAGLAAFDEKERLDQEAAKRRR